MDPVSPSAHLCATGHCYPRYVRAIQYQYISLRYVLDNAHMLLQSHLGSILLLPPFSLVTIVQVSDFSFCNASWNSIPFMFDVFMEIPRFVLGATLLILAVTQTLKHSVNMYKATKHWQLNRYMERLVRDGIIYFLVYVAVFHPRSFPFAIVAISSPPPPPHLALEMWRQLTFPLNC